MSKKLKEKVINDLINNVYCRFKPSKISGVGVFAIRDIPKGINPFKQFFPIGSSIKVNPQEVFDNPNIASGVKKMVRDLYVIDKGVLDLPVCSLNDLSIAFFVNSSKNPNLVTNNGETLVTKRKIKKGEELTADYGTYTDS